MLNPLRDFVAFDLETTGLERDTDEIIEIGAVRVRGGAIEDRMSCFLKAAKALTPLVESLTGIDKGMLEGAKEPKEGLEEFLRFAGGLPLVAHNSDFDASFLEHALSKAGMPPLANPVFDSLLLARTAWPTMDSHRLENLVDKLGIPPQKAHRALPDAEQAAFLWLKAEEKLASYSPRTQAALGRVLSTGPAHWRGLFGGDAASPEIDSAALVAGAGPGKNQPASASAAGAAPAKTPEGSSESLFAAGKIAEAFSAIGRAYQNRPRQARMASLAERTFKESRILVAEAEPGTGRLLGCLVPALRHAQARRRPVVVAVPGRKALERIVASEVPLLKALLGEGIRVEPLKSPASYLSPRKLAGILAHPETRLSREERLAILPILTWLEETAAGDITGNMGFNHERNRLLWSKLASDTYAAEPGSHAHAARDRAAKAQIILISHDLFLDDLALDFALLPAYEAIVFDEAHRLPEAGQARLGRDVSFFRLKHILQLLAHSKSDASGLLAELRRSAGLNPVLENEGAPQGSGSAPAAAPDAALPEAMATESSDGAEEAPAADATAPAAAASAPKSDLELLRLKAFEPERQLQKFFNKIAKHAQKRRKDGENRIRYADKLVVEFNAGPDAVVASLTELEELLARLAGNHPDLAAELRKAADHLRTFRADLEHLAHPSAGGEVFWIEDFPNPHRALIRCAPLEIGTLLSEKFYPQMDAVMFVSPALALGDDFKFFCRQIGLETAHQDRLKTAMVRAKDPGDRPDPLFIARFSPVVSNNGALQTMGQILVRGLKRFPRPSFALFTHIGMLKQARTLLQEGISQDGRMVMAQHVDGSRDNLIHLFRQRPDACLLGTESFVESLGDGDSIPEIVIVTKLPFPVPTEPLVAPHLEKLQESGQNPLYDFLLPHSILRLKQELNRLPRRPGRRIAIWIMDPRLATEKYARFYQRSLGRDAVVCESEADLMAKTAALMGLDPVEPEARASAETGTIASAEIAGTPIAEPDAAAAIVGESTDPTAA
jgi:DNA polymerase III epsilon subunit family exonuclease